LKIDFKATSSGIPWSPMASKRSASFWCAVSLAALASPLLYPTDPHSFGRLSTLGSPSKMKAAQRFKHHPFLEVATKQLKAGVRMAVAKEPRKKEGGKLQTITAHPHFGIFSTLPQAKLR
jgi:hypothetical protein